MTTRSKAGSVTVDTPKPSRARSGDTPSGHRGHQMGMRFVVHLVLLAAFAASLATVTAMTEGWGHLVIGSAFVGLVVIHVAQRRHTVARLLGKLGRPPTWLTRRGRLAGSDLILALLTVNVLASGTYDLATGNQVILQPRNWGIPFRDIGWHVSAALLLTAYLVVHVTRRWGRIRRSVIR